MKDTIKKVRILMVHVGINDKELAKRMGISASTLSLKFRNGKFSEKDLIRIADACNVDINIDVTFKLADGTVI